MALEHVNKNKITFLVFTVISGIFIQTTRNHISYLQILIFLP